jgi:undecaprenyl phosphate-alpha-L-ara4N flippase subunit ArnE
MPLKTIFLALLTVALNASAQLCLRVAAVRGATPSRPLTLAASPFFSVALVAYGTSVLTWLLVLRSVPLSIAMPFNAAIYVVVPVLAYLVFNDAIDRRSLLGMLLVVAGILVVARRG